MASSSFFSGENRPSRYPFPFKICCSKKKKKKREREEERRRERESGGEREERERERRDDLEALLEVLWKHEGDEEVWNLAFTGDVQLRNER